MAFYVDDPYAAWHLLLLFLKLVPSPVARCRGNGITFRTHTLTHPGMSGTPRTDPSSAQWAGGQQSTPPVGPLRHLHPQHSGFSAPALWVPEFGPRLWTLGDGKRSPPQIVTLPPTKTCSSYRPGVAFQNSARTAHPTNADFPQMRCSLKRNEHFYSKGS